MRRSSVRAVARILSGSSRVSSVTARSVPPPARVVRRGRRNAGEGWRARRRRHPAARENRAARGGTRRELGPGMLATVHAGCLLGIDAHPVQVEVQLGAGLPGFDIVGLPERGVKESRVRVKSALQAFGFKLPPRHLVLNLAPGDVRKTGAGYDLAIAIAVQAACEAVDPAALRETLLLGELGLSGALRPVRGALSQLRGARDRGLARAIVPRGNAAEARLANGIEVYVADELSEVVAFLNGEATLRLADADPATTDARAGGVGPDLADVRGQGAARRALEIAAAGRHNLLLLGAPGGGKTMLARRLVSVLPPPDAEEAMDIATIASAAGLYSAGIIAGVERPFRAPHHTASAAALIGGGDPVRPGEVTLAHGGVLFLDELPEFRRDVIESLRTTMESGKVSIVRARARVTMPAAPLVVAAMNPCPCGFAGDPERICACSPDRVARYRGRVSGPLLDRFDMHVNVPRVRARELRETARGETSADVRARVVAARAEAPPIGVDLGELHRRASGSAIRLLDRAVEQLGLSARGYVKALRVAQTIARLEGGDVAMDPHVAEAIQFRQLDRRPPGRA